MAGIGLGRVRGVGREAEARQIHLGKMRGHRRLLIGILWDGHLLDQSLVTRDEVDQCQGFVGFGLLQLNGDFIFRFLRFEARGGWLGVFDHLAVQVQYRHRAGILLGHPLDQHVFERLGVHRLEQASERAFAGHVTLSARSGARAAAQISALSVIEALDKFGDGMGVFAAGAHGQGDQCQDRRQLMAFALGLAGIGRSVAKSLPERRQLLGGYRAGGWQGPLMFRQVRGQFGGTQLFQR